jgi:hypothetical protein
VFVIVMLCMRVASGLWMHFTVRGSRGVACLLAFAVRETIAFILII